MADFEYSGDTGPQEAHPEDGVSPGGGLVTIAGALTSLALVVGIGYWGYSLLMRDVSGVPVVRALEGPMRETPKDPGGEAADYQGLAVNAVAAQGVAAPTADRLILAPRPVDLTEDDKPAAQLAPAGTPDPDAADPGTATTEAVVTALVEELTEGAGPLSGDERMPVPGAAEDDIVQPAPLGTVDAGEAPAPEPALLNAPGVKQSPRPVPRPAGLVLASAGGDEGRGAAIDAALQEVAVLDVDPDSLEAGALMAQLGAYDSPEIARAEWDRFQSRFAVYLDGKKRVIQQASSGGRTFYRLRALGFDDMADARRFCSALVAERADCIPVVLR